ncbi:MAG: universal stress protein, partial [Candidatus Accumulibacter sp.]|nr:universal stress protein [Accumulibacter sp.]
MESLYHSRRRRALGFSRGKHVYLEKSQTTKKGVAMLFKHILVATDGSELSQDSARHAVSFAQDTGAKITVFYAKPEYPVTYYGEGVLIDTTSPEKFAELAETQAQEILGVITALCQEANVPCTPVSVTSDIPHEAIIEAA